MSASSNDATARTKLGGLLASMMGALLNAYNSDEVETKRCLMREVVEMLRVHPRFGVAYFRVPLPVDLAGFTPLMVLLFVEADVDTIGKVCDLNPEALLDAVAGDRCPLAFACRGMNVERVSEEVIVLLAEKCPAALKLADADGDLPLGIALAQRWDAFSVSAIRSLIDLCHEIVLLEDRKGNIPLGVAIASYCDLDVIEFLARRFPKDENTLKIVGGENEVIFGELAEIFPQLEHLHLAFVDWEDEALECFLSELQCNNSITTLHLALPYSKISGDAQCRDLLTKCLSLNTTINTLKVWKCRDDETEYDHDGPVLQALADGLQSKLEFDLWVNDLRLPDIQSLIVFLLSDKAPNIVRLDDLRICSSRQPCMEDMTRLGAAQSKLERLRIIFWHMDPMLCEPLVSQLSKLPVLKELILGNVGEEVALPVSMFNLLESTSSLLSLGLLPYGLKVDHEKLCKALQQNTSLKWIWIGANEKEPYIDLLMNHNATLQEIDFI